MTLRSNLPIAFLLALTGACAGDDGDDTMGDTGADDGPADDADDGQEAPAEGDSETGTPDDGNDDGAELSPECTALCAHTETATDIEAQCTPPALEELGGYSFNEQECQDFAAAFAQGNATSLMCVACYIAADVQAGHCTDAESTCF